MENVWVIIYGYSDGRDWRESFQGVFSSKEKALEAIPSYCRTVMRSVAPWRELEWLSWSDEDEGYDIYECEIDKAFR